MWQTLLSLDPRLQAGIIAGIVGLLTGFVGPIVTHYLDRWALSHRLDTEYRHDERKKLRQLIGEFHGRVLAVADRLNGRMSNLQRNEGKGWLNVDGSYGDPRAYYYFTSTIERFLALHVRLREFQDKAIFIDARIAKADDLLFLSFCKALQWVTTDTALFKGLPYDSFSATDHMFAGKLDVACEAFLKDGEPMTLGEFEKRLETSGASEDMQPVFEFFDGLRSNETRLRWDRMVAFHLLLIAFVNHFGYTIQATSSEDMASVVESAKNQRVLANLREWLPQLGLDRSKSVTTLMHLLPTETQ